MISITQITQMGGLVGSSWTAIHRPYMQKKATTRTTVTSSTSTVVHVVKYELFHGVNNLDF